MAQRKARTKGGRTARGATTPQVYRVPGVRVSVVCERWVRMRRRPVIQTSGALAAALSACIPADDEREHFVMVTLDVRRRLLGVHTLSIGCLTGSIVHPRELLRLAVLMGACTISVGHNHCSGDPEPSSEDVELTWRLMSCLELVGIEFGDHVVLGSAGRWVSMRERGCLETDAQQRSSRGQPARSTKTAAPAPPVPKVASGS